MNIEEWKSQIKRGTLEYCVLLMISKKECYGYEIMNELNKFDIIATKESTTYLLLRRLQKDEYLNSHWVDTAEGLPPRKYYSLTEKGKLYLNRMSEEWNNLLNAIGYMKGNKNG